jgi:spermidine synthase
MLLGITTFITTDIAAVPLLWVMPLAIYLLTFILVFARRPTLSHNLMVKVQPFLVLPVMMVFLFRGAAAPGLVTILLHIFAFFVTAMVCHGELVRSRPPAAHLTEFYLWLAVGGVLGGAFNSLVAPVVFDSVAEYPLAIVLACLLRPPKNPNGKKPRDLRLDFLFPLILFVMLAGLALGMKAYSVKTGITGITVIACLVAVFCYSFAHRPIRFGMGLASIMLTATFWSALGGSALLTERSFFGVHEVSETREGRYYTLYHGTTLHGAQSRDPTRRMEPLTYYHREGPLGQVFEKFSGQEVAVVGLGTGSMAGYAKPGEHWTFYEIDPAVVRIASDPRYFTFLKDAPAKVRVVLGDARLKLEDAPDGIYDLIVLDAFSSDAIPVHLVTKEALELYLAKLADNGIIAFHVSNRYLDLEMVLGDLAHDAGLFSLVQEMKVGMADQEEFKRNSTWVVMARKAGDLKGLADNPRWGPLKASGGGGLWTDDFSNIISVLK